ncbi:M24 family metallopeptidase [Neptunicella marina]|uniref:Aminopeptidase P family protein n=1 Tax=Neptunicella marina TaxID=2125989 RepID=A0A8J6IYP9_9ALTE|nr:aminopeptidase P family protein [Neptunicella marina]
MTKRQFLKTGTALFASAGLTSMVKATPKKNTPGVLSDITKDARPISEKERKLRIEKAQQLMQQQHLSALVLEPGAAMDYFSGIQWWRSERLTALVIPAKGEIAVVCPFFEEPSIRESLAIDDDVRVWQEHESPFALIKEILLERGAINGRIGFEHSVRYFVLDGLQKAIPDLVHVNADSVTRGCRMIKTAHEIALMHKASEVTLKAYEYVWQNLAEGMTQQDVKSMMHKAQQQLGGHGIWNMALFDEASAYPHGTKQQHVIRKGSVVLMDCGCSVHGYQSDISRTFVFGEPDKKVQKVWQTVRKGQQIAFENARLNQPAGQVDDAVRNWYTARGFGPAYKLPGLSHRTGHGIGMEGHEPVNFVHGEMQALKPGMCFSNEPGIYLPGEFGVRLEDCIYMTENGPVWFTEPAQSIESPIGKLMPLAV